MLSGSKYGVRQTRGKFGLGAKVIKDIHAFYHLLASCLHVTSRVQDMTGSILLFLQMALIWSKQSTGMPVEVRSSTSASGQVSLCVLDIDIQKNEPRVKLHEKVHE